jgi:hypothetical protein
MHQRDELPQAPQWRVKRNLVQILDDYVVVVRREPGGVIPARKEWVCVTIPDPVDVYTVEIHPLRSVLPRAAKKIHLVSALDDATEHFLEMKLGTARVRILVILPIEYEYPH